MERDREDARVHEVRDQVPHQGDPGQPATTGRRDRGEEALPLPPLWAAERVLEQPWGCWVWTGPRDADGYGLAKFRGVLWRVHRYAWTEAAGRGLPRDVELDHRCRNRACFRPTHLEPVLRKENARRRSARQRLTLERCPGGHRLEEPNGIATPEGGVVCALCDGAKLNALW